jgi:hypothetical protein
MADDESELLKAVNEIRDLLRLIAEPAIAARDKKLRDELRQIVGNSKPKANAVLLMDGTRTQKHIHDQTGMNKGNLSTLVRQLSESRLLSGDGKNPRLSIAIPVNFFERDDTDE